MSLPHQTREVHDVQYLHAHPPPEISAMSHTLPALPQLQRETCLLLCWVLAWRLTGFSGIWERYTLWALLRSTAEPESELENLYKRLYPTTLLCSCACSLLSTFFLLEHSSVSPHLYHIYIPSSRLRVLLLLLILTLPNDVIFEVVLTTLAGFGNRIYIFILA